MPGNVRRGAMKRSGTKIIMHTTRANKQIIFVSKIEAKRTLGIGEDKLKKYIESGDLLKYMNEYWTVDELYEG